MRSPKSLIRKARLNPEAKKPPNGAINEAKTPFKVLYQFLNLAKIYGFGDRVS